jgi:hypothetical protein
MFRSKGRMSSSSPGRCATSGLLKGVANRRGIPSAYSSRGSLSLEREWAFHIDHLTFTNLLTWRKRWAQDYSKPVGLAVLAIFGTGAGCFLKEDFALRAKGGLTISQAIMQSV